MNHQYELRTGLGKFKDEILAPIEINSQDTTNRFEFQAHSKRSKAMMSKKRDKRDAKATGKAFDAPVKYLIYPSLSQFLFMFINLNFLLVPP